MSSSIDPVVDDTIDDTNDQPDEQQLNETSTLSVQDTIDMPLTSISRIIKTALPNNIMISKEVKQSLCKSAGIFILYITSYANDSCHTSKRTTVTANDILNAVKEAELTQFIPSLNYYLTEYRKDMTNKRNKQLHTNTSRNTNKSTLVKPPASKRQRSDSNVPQTQPVTPTQSINSPVTTAEANSNEHDDDFVDINPDDMSTDNVES